MDSRERLTPGTLVYTDVNIAFIRMCDIIESLPCRSDICMLQLCHAKWVHQRNDYGGNDGQDLGEAYKIPDDMTLRSATPGPSSPRKRQHSQPNMFMPSPKKRPPPKREPINLAERDKSLDMRLGHQVEYKYVPETPTRIYKVLSSG